MALGAVSTHELLEVGADRLIREVHRFLQELLEHVVVEVRRDDVHVEDSALVVPFEERSSHGQGHAAQALGVRASPVGDHGEHRQGWYLLCHLHRQVLGDLIRPDHHRAHDHASANVDGAGGPARDAARVGEDHQGGGTAQARAEHGEVDGPGVVLGEVLAELDLEDIGVAVLAVSAEATGGDHGAVGEVVVPAGGADGIGPGA
ncbi:MAG: hypothetical protein KDK70_03795 [Myxococcales bacterium]|nr:hypothetical protein [Myxococcales bacterium]